MKHSILFTILASVAFLFASPSISSAEDKPKVKTFDFLGDDINSELVKLDGEDVSALKHADYKSLIHIRLDFIDEILKSAEDL